jgi:polyisoprenyl-teichoic acid--peptidoglycan teichoic acid transferase
VVLNVHGLVELVNELGGINVEIPKRMKYMDWTAKLKIDLEPGYHTLTGNQAMGFVRFRHDALGDIGRVQRQEIFLRAVLDKAMKPESWSHVPELVRIGRQYITSDLSDADMLSILNFVRGVPKKSQQLVMLPGRFSADGTGNWEVDSDALREISGKLTGSLTVLNTKPDVRVTVQNASSHQDLGRRLARMLRSKGYNVVAVIGGDHNATPINHTRIIAQKANPEDAEMIRIDMSNIGEVVNASVGDIETSVTVVAGDDAEAMLRSTTIQPVSR